MASFAVAVTDAADITVDDAVAIDGSGSSGDSQTQQNSDTAPIQFDG